MTVTTRDLERWQASAALRQLRFDAELAGAESLVDAIDGIVKLAAPDSVRSFLLGGVQFGGGLFGVALSSVALRLCDWQLARVRRAT